MVTLGSAARAALSTMSLCFRRPCVVVEGVVVPRRRPASLIQTQSTLASMAPCRWRARLMANVMFATSEALMGLQVSTTCNAWIGRQSGC